MKTSILLLYPILAFSFPSVASSQRFLPSFWKQRTSPATAQMPIVNPPEIALPPSNQDNPTPGSSGDIIISDILGKERGINVFAGFTRDIESVSDRLQDSSVNTTVLAPLNPEITKLPRKPWEDPQDYETLGETAYDGQEGEGRAHKNLRRFTEAHIIPASPWREGQKIKTLAGNTVWFESKGGKKLVQPGSLEVEGVLTKATNGEVWLLRGVLNYA
ncbi:MAG: hypothetical protein M1819_001917 [Sarea resinae]|nr:MAG: hypothetical protein M1819_001917 [Sarea resinae]